MAVTFLVNECMSAGQMRPLSMLTVIPANLQDDEGICIEAFTNEKRQCIIDTKSFPSLTSLEESETALS